MDSAADLKTESNDDVTANGDHEDSTAKEVKNGIMNRRRNKKSSNVTIKEEFLLLPPTAPDQVGKGGFAYLTCWQRRADQWIIS